MKTNEEIMKAKSVHIFAWPFRYEKEKRIFKKEIEKRGWIKRNLDFITRNEKASVDQDTKDCFMLYQYLSQSARDIFIHKDICSIYEYPFEEGKYYQYYIKKKIKEEIKEEIKEYYIPIASIQLHVYEYGVGILFIQVWNQDYDDIDDIKKINDYGRRVSLPFLDKTSLLCADVLGILVDGRFVQKTDFKDIAVKYLNEELADKKKALKQAGFLYDLLNCNLNHNKNNDITVIPHTDDRMFVCSLIRDTELSGMVRGGLNNAELLYSILFVDPSDASCQNGEMRKKLLEEAIYPRWTDYGTLYGATAYSLCCITAEAENINENVVRPFLVEYSYFVSLVLAQRIGIIAFTAQTGKSVSGLNNKRNWRKKGVGFVQAARLSRIQKQYIDFKNRLLILEASTQDQGIDIYQLLQKQLYVKGEREILDGKLQSLYEAASINIGNKLAAVGIIISVLTSFLELDKLVELIEKICKFIYQILPL